MVDTGFIRSIRSASLFFRAAFFGPAAALRLMNFFVVVLWPKTGRAPAWQCLCYESKYISREHRCVMSKNRRMSSNNVCGVGHSDFLGVGPPHIQSKPVDKKPNQETRSWETPWVSCILSQQALISRNPGTLEFPGFLAFIARLFFLEAQGAAPVRRPCSIHARETIKIQT